VPAVIVKFRNVLLRLATMAAAAGMVAIYWLVERSDFSLYMMMVLCVVMLANRSNPTNRQAAIEADFSDTVV
jgi:uncharacterized membrane protein YhaH (DUF805 family)